MKQIILFVLSLVLMIGAISCIDQEIKGEKAQASTSSTINVYYFHFTLRCETCLAVEENARKALKELYPNEVQIGEYSFTAMNLDQASTKEIADKLGVGGQTLLVVKGDNKLDITSACFINAHDIDKIKLELKSAIDKVLL